MLQHESKEQLTFSTTFLILISHDFDKFNFIQILKKEEKKSGTLRFEIMKGPNYLVSNFNDQQLNHAKIIYVDINKRIRDQNNYFKRQTGTVRCHFQLKAIIKQINLDCSRPNQLIIFGTSTIDNAIIQSNHYFLTFVD